jgi:hypothetical protein
MHCGSCSISLPETVNLTIYSGAAAASIRKSPERQRAPPKPARHMTPVHLVSCLAFFSRTAADAGGVTVLLPTDHCTQSPVFVVYILSIKAFRHRSPHTHCCSQVDSIVRHALVVGSPDCEGAQDAGTGSEKQAGGQVLQRHVHSVCGVSGVDCNNHL